MLILRIYLKFLNCVALFSPLYLQIKFKPRLNVRSQKFAIGGGCLGSLGAEPPIAIGGLKAKPPAAGGWRSGGKAYNRRRHGGLERGPPCSKILHFVAKIT